MVFSYWEGSFELWHLQHFLMWQWTVSNTYCLIFKTYHINSSDLTWSNHLFLDLTLILSGAITKALQLLNINANLADMHDCRMHWDVKWMLSPLCAYLCVETRYKTEDWQTDAPVLLNEWIERFSCIPLYLNAQTQTCMQIYALMYHYQYTISVKVYRNAQPWTHPCA